MIGTLNVQTIALEVPAALLTRDRAAPGKTKQPRLGAYASTSRPKVTVLRTGRADDDREFDDLRLSGGRPVQVQRLANPLINETIIGTKDKDRWNATDPNQEEQFLDYYRNPRLALALQLVFGVPADTAGREDLVDLLLRYGPGEGNVSELLRLDLSVPPTPLAQQRRMTVLATPPDPAAKYPSVFPSRDTLKWLTKPVPRVRRRGVPSAFPVFGSIPTDHMFVSV